MMNAIAKKFPISCLTNKRPPQNLHGITLVHDPIAIGPWNMPHAFLYREDRRAVIAGISAGPLQVHLVKAHGHCPLGLEVFFLRPLFSCRGRRGALSKGK